MTAALYLSRANKKVALIERIPAGGQTGILNDIVNYPGFQSVSGYDLIESMTAQAVSFGTELIYDEPDAVALSTRTVSFSDGRVLNARALVLATGCKARALGLKGEDALSQGLGVSYCATCDGAFFKGRTVAVAGGGAKARQEAKYLLPLAKTVYFITPDGESLEGATAVRGQVTALIGSPLSGVTVSDGKATQTIDTDALFVYAGLTPQSQMFMGQLELDEKGFIVVDGEMRTSVANVYAAGDVVVKSLRQIVTAAADGAIAAATALKELKNNKG